MRKYQVKKKNRKLLHKEKGKRVNAPFYRLNLVDEYNLGMGNVDQADQLRLQYRIHYWLRNRKWWWAIFFWCYELALTNSFILYKLFYKLHKKTHPLNHFEFMRQIVLAWIDPDTYWPVNEKRDSSSVSTTSSFTSPRPSKRIREIPKRNTTFTDKALDPYTGILRCYLDTSLDHLPDENDKAEGSCQMHYWQDKTKYRKQLLKCATCQVCLCIKCYKTFHTIPNLIPIKENFAGLDNVLVPRSAKTPRRIFHI